MENRSAYTLGGNRPQELIPSHVEWNASKQVDPTGYLFFHQEGVYRAIKPKAARKVRHLFDSGIVSELVERGLLIDSSIADLHLPGFDLVVRHPRLPFVTLPEAWPQGFLLDAAKMVVDLNLALLPHRFGTIDYHGHNVAQVARGRPIWLDFGSIVPQAFTRLSHMHDELCSWFIYPLVLCREYEKLSRLCRIMLCNGGVRRDDFMAITGYDIAPPEGDRARYLATVRDWLESFSPVRRKTFWGDYYGKGDDRPTWDPRSASAQDPESRPGIVMRLIREHAPCRLVDLGCNTGKFSVMAARSGCTVCAVDSDEGAVERFYHFLDDLPEHLAITLLQRDIGNAGLQRRSPVKGDLVLALAVTHHMHLSQHQPMDLIAYLLSSYSTRSLVTEFMPDGLGTGTPVPDPLPSGYTLGRFTDAFKPYFRDIEVVRYPSGSSRRIFVICRNRTDVDALVKCVPPEVEAADDSRL